MRRGAFSYPIRKAAAYIAIVFPVIQGSAALAKKIDC